MKKKLIAGILCLSCIGLRVTYGDELAKSTDTHPLTYIAILPNMYISLRMKDDSMSPVIDEGDVIIAYRMAPYEQHAIHLVRLKKGNEKLIRNVSEEEEGLLLTPINQIYSSRLVPHEEVADIIRVIQASRDPKRKA